MEPSVEPSCPGGPGGALDNRDRKIRDRVSMEGRQGRGTGRQTQTQKSRGQGRVMRKRDKEGEKHGQQQPARQMNKYRQKGDGGPGVGGT